MSYVHIKRVQGVDITHPHNVRIGDTLLTIKPVNNDLQFKIDPSDKLYARVVGESDNDWYQYGVARDYIHKTSLGYELWIFSKNNSPIDFNKIETKNSSKKNKKSYLKSWW